MRISKIGKLTCSVARTVGVIGDPWTLLLIRELFLHSRRFDDFQAYTGMAPRLLSSRLARLAAHGIVIRVPYREHPPRHEYRLTDKGLDLYPAIVSLTRWGDRWMAPRGEAPLTLRHRGCGKAMTPVLHCPGCGEEIRARDVEVRMSASMRKERERMLRRRKKA